jgi:hypothetical protein
MLEEIYTIKRLANLAEIERLALSSSIKRFMSGRRTKRDANGIYGGLKSWEMFKVKREMVQDGS